MNKFAKVYIQKYKYKHKITIEIDLSMAYKNKGFHKLFRLYQKHCNQLEEQDLLIKKSSLQYCGKHLLQLEVGDIRESHSFLSAMSELGYVEFEFV